MNNKRKLTRFLNITVWVFITLLFSYVLMKSSVVFSSANLRQTIDNMGDELVTEFSNQIIISNSPILQYVSATNSNGNSQNQITRFINNVFPINHYSLAAFKENLIKENEAYLMYNQNEFYDSQDIVNMIEENQEIDDNQEAEETMANSDYEISFIRGETYLEEIPNKYGKKLDAILSNNKKMITQLETEKDFDYLIHNFYTVDSSTNAIKQLFNVSHLLKKDMTIKQKNDKPQILIYHTHSQEDFIDSRKGNSADTVVGVGAYLKNILTEQYGYNVIHDTSTYDLIKGQLDRNRSYNYALDGIQSILDKNPSIEVVIDLHRDGVQDTKRVITYIGGKPTAPLMFFNGLSRNKQGPIEYLKNPYITDNLAFSLQLHIKSLSEYPKFTKRIYLKNYRYNQHLIPKSLLIELGNQNNTVADARNAMEPFADILDEVLQEE